MGQAEYRKLMKKLNEEFDRKVDALLAALVERDDARRAELLAEEARIKTEKAEKLKALDEEYAERRRDRDAQIERLEILKRSLKQKLQDLPETPAPVAPT